MCPIELCELELEDDWPLLKKVVTTLCRRLDDDLDRPPDAFGPPVCPPATMTCGWWTDRDGFDVVVDGKRLAPKVTGKCSLASVRSATPRRLSEEEEEEEGLEAAAPPFSVEEDMSEWTREMSRGSVREPSLSTCDVSPPVTSDVFGDTTLVAHRSSTSLESNRSETTSSYWGDSTLDGSLCRVVHTHWLIRSPRGSPRGLQVIWYVRGVPINLFTTVTQSIHVTVTKQLRRFMATFCGCCRWWIELRLTGVRGTPRKDWIRQTAIVVTFVFVDVVFRFRERIRTCRQLPSNVETMRHTNSCY